MGSQRENDLEMQKHARSFVMFCVYSQCISHFTSYEPLC